MGRVNRDRGQKRIDLALKVVLGKGPRFLVELFPLQQPDTVFAQLGQQVLVPAAVLRSHKRVNLGGQHGEGFVGAQAVVAGLAIAVFDALHEAGLADFDVLIEVRAGNGQEFDALQQGIGRVPRLLPIPAG